MATLLTSARFARVPQINLCLLCSAHGKLYDEGSSQETDPFAAAITADCTSGVKLSNHLFALPTKDTVTVPLQHDLSNIYRSLSMRTSGFSFSHPIATL